jgi:hypothetical protein
MIIKDAFCFKTECGPAPIDVENPAFRFEHGERALYKKDQSHVLIAQ